MVPKTMEGGQRHLKKISRIIFDESVNLPLPFYGLFQVFIH